MSLTLQLWQRALNLGVAARGKGSHALKNTLNRAGKVGDEKISMDHDYTYSQYPSFRKWI